MFSFQMVKNGIQHYYYCYYYYYSMGRYELEHIQFLSFLLILYNKAFVGSSLLQRDGLPF